jgi:hypothetical protein
MGDSRQRIGLKIIQILACRFDLFVESDCRDNAYEG